MDYSPTAFLRYLSLRTVMHELLPNYWDRFNVAPIFRVIAEIASHQQLF